MDLGLVSLHKHWVTADALDFHLRRSLASPEPQEAHGVPAALAEIGEKLSAFAVISVWYSLLFVIVEGYQELKIQDDEIDALLARDDLLNALRLFRNATFHFQREPISPKLLGLLTTPDSEVWLKDLNRAFRRFFENSLEISDVVERFGKL